jgi:predicted glycosyltransferase
MKLLGEEFQLIGRYDPETLASRLKASLDRELRFCEMFENEPPDIAISHGSVELCRVAFGLGVHSICTGDTLYTQANWLIVPLVDKLVISESIPKPLYQRYGARHIIQYAGVDEAAWVQPTSSQEHLKYEHPLIVIRQSEFRASYMTGEDITTSVAKRLASLGNVLFIPRYRRERIDGLTIPDDFVDSLTLVKDADLVVGVGGTIAREAALQGTPTLVIPVLGWAHVNDYLSRKGFPIYRVDLGNVEKLARKYLGKRVDTAALLRGLENPINVIEALAKDYEKQSKYK